MSLLPDKLPASLDNAVKNMTDAPTKNIGTTFADLWFLVFGGVSQAAEKRKLRYQHALDEFKIQIETKLDAVPEENRIEPNTRLATQALESAKYCLEDPQLREMFAILIAHTCDNRTNKRLHPAFSEILKHLSPVDAALVSSFRQKTGTKIAVSSKTYINGELVEKSAPPDFDTIKPSYYTYPETIMPIARFYLSAANSTNPHGKKLIIDNVILSDISDDIYLLSTSLTNLHRLGLVEITINERLANYNYDNFKKCSLYKDWEIFVNSTDVAFRFIRGNSIIGGQHEKIGIDAGTAKLTELGFNFLSCCAIDAEVVRE